MHVNIHTALLPDGDPFGDATLVPAPVQLSEVELASCVADALVAAGASFEIMQRLFPYSPLTVRVAALAALMRVT
jgi:hypothetical protein